MWSSVRSSTRPLLRLRRLKRPSRTFLSASYPCTDAWNKRFESPLLSKINPSDMFLELDQKYQSTGSISAVDVDIFANTVKDDERVDELVDILHKLRLTMQTTSTLDSTHHAVVKYFLEMDEKTLLEVLNDRLNYGIFPDHFSYNLLMDTFIKRKDFASAAKVATLLMLQEDQEHPICNALAVYSCHKYLENTEGWGPPPPPPPVDPKEEVVKVRVRYLRNPYFDDHFDLTDPKHLVGKTFVFFGKSMDDTLGRSLVLRGYVLWGKFERAAEVGQGWVDGNVKDVVYKEALELVTKDLEGVEGETTGEDVEKVKEVLGKLQGMTLKEGSMEGEMEERIKKAVVEREQGDIEEQCKLYEEWEKIRMDLLQKQLAEIDRQQRLKDVEAMKKDLQVRERLLTFFENEEKLELQIEEKLKIEDEMYGPPIEVKEDTEDNYIPPEVGQQSTKNRI
ncbi:28S ribosomal protein S27, mitochondrial [Diachasma alloeum]|uniref:28S ribosomal protein S27, mitochondrial n=1 Tax=Diachasma alloeum TaxID=454923 RepID=UPI0007382B54|nr:28S ribosomal protein S27, mitochondrial [Diachasma alloeum]